MWLITPVWYFFRFLGVLRCFDLRWVVVVCYFCLGGGFVCWLVFDLGFSLFAFCFIVGCGLCCGLVVWICGLGCGCFVLLDLLILLFACFRFIVGLLMVLLFAC